MIRDFGAFAGLSSKFAAVAVLAALAATMPGGTAHALAMGLSAAADEGRDSFDRGTGESEEDDPGSLNRERPSEDGTQQEARPDAPDFGGGCIFHDGSLNLEV